MIVVALLASLAVNGLLVWYLIRLMKKYLPWSEDIEDLKDVLSEYHFHIKVVSEMESFYGDEIILNLLKHSRAVVDEVETFSKAYSLLGEDDELDELEEGYLDGDEEEDNPGEEEAPLQRKVVFHQGS